MRKRKLFSEKDKETIFHWVLVAVVFAVVYVSWMIWGFITNCIFTWPIRLDVNVCWSEQKIPAHEKAIDAAGHLM